jgi:tRNA threonylcarbamoyladenosine biosynthesis protein TsaE
LESRSSAPPLFCYHFDLYRLSPPEVDALQLETYWEGLEVVPGIVAIEWPDRLQYPPADHLEIQLVDTPTGARQATLREVGALGQSFPDFNQAINQ